jgi:large subunit ribosomal protein L29
MKTKGLRELTDEELQQQILDRTEELFRLRYEAASGVADNPARIRTVRRQIARLKTILREHKLGLR